MERRLEHLEQASRSKNITLSTTYKEKPSARPTGIVKDVSKKLPAQYYGQYLLHRSTLQASVSSVIPFV